MRHIIKFMVTGAYSGLLPLAPGTLGTLVGLFLAGILWYFFPQFPLLTLLAGLFLFGIGIPLAGWAEKNLFASKDPGAIVIDEISGICVTCSPLAFWDISVFSQKGFAMLFSAFLLFRFFDIVKVYPVNRAEKISGGLGIMLDDLIAGIYSAGFLWILYRLTL